MTDAPGHILVVEDSPTQRALTALVLEHAGYPVRQAADGQEALEAIGSSLPMLVISDVIMPRIDGYELCRRLRQDPATATLPVVLVSMQAGPDDILQGLQAGADNFIIKPIEPPDLVARVNAIVALLRCRSREELYVGQERITADRQQIFELLMTSMRTLMVARTSLDEKVRELSAKNQQVEELSRRKDEFVALVSHELRVPLTSLRGSLSVLAAGVLGPLPEKGQRMLDIALTSIDRMARLINDLLDVERLDSGRVQLDLQPWTVTDLLEQAADVVRPLAESEGVSLQMHPLDAEVAVDGDRIVQALTNLLSNAVKFSPPHGRVVLEASLLGDTLELSVSDQGEGIPAERQAEIFEPFHQLRISDAKEKGGTGLGLAICRGIAQQHGGRIRVESEPGRGSRFIITVPVRHPRP